MNTKTIITLLLVGAAIVLLPPVIEFWSAQNTQSNTVKVLIEKPNTTNVNLKDFELARSLRTSLFWLGTFVICVAIGFMWYQRKLCVKSPNLK